MGEQAAPMAAVTARVSVACWVNARLRCSGRPNQSAFSALMASMPSPGVIDRMPSKAKFNLYRNYRQSP